MGCHMPDYTSLPTIYMVAVVRSLTCFAATINSIPANEACIGSVLATVVHDD